MSAPDKYSTIGFTVTSETVNELLDRAWREADRSRTVATKDGWYLPWTRESVAELWIIGMGDEFIGFAPHFAGSTRVLVRPERRLARHGLTDLDGGFHGWLLDDGWAEPGSTGWYPLVFDCPDFRGNDHVELPAALNVQLAAFAMSEIELYEDEAGYSAEHPGMSFFPSGTFALEEGDVAPAPTAEAIFSGVVRQAEYRRDDPESAGFHHLVVETYGMTIDVVVDPRFMPRPARVGDIASGSFWLTGRVLR